MAEVKIDVPDEVIEKITQQVMHVDEQAMRGAIDQYFEELHSTLWGKPFYLIGEGGAAAQSRINAVDFLAEAMTAVLGNLGFTITKPDPNQLELDV